MHDLNNIGPRIIFKFGDSGVYITETVLYGLLVAVVIAVLAIWSASKLQQVPKGKQVVAEMVVKSIYNLVRTTMGQHCMTFAPYIGTLFSFLILGNMLGLFGLRPMTADVNMTFALAGVTFILIQYNGVKSGGIKERIHHWCDPYPFLLPIKLIEEISFPVSLGFRLFGNILGGVIVMALVFNGLEWLSHKALAFTNIPLLQAVIPLPLNFFFDIFEPILQAFIFTMLTMVFLSMAISTHEEH